jgi:probable O-glycosylation ligase (exosortase A-associated)
VAAQIMRAAFFTFFIFAALVQTLFYPFAGVLVWTWFSLLQPQDETLAFGYTRIIPFNTIIVLFTVATWLAGRERKMPPPQFLVVAVGVFLAWTTINSFHAFDPHQSWPIWNGTWKIIALGLLIATLATTQVRIHAIVVTSVLSLFYYGVKGGLVTFMSGGRSRVGGPLFSIIGDNNQLALALLMAIPLAVYLIRVSANRWVSRALSVAIALTIVSIIGSYSRGALISLAVLGFIWILSARRGLLYLGLGASVAGGAMFFMPASFWQRAGSIQTIFENGSQADPSVHGRILGWHVAYYYARDHFPWGAGFYCPQLPELFDRYFPGEKPHAAHSIYFQVLGEQGFIGLAIYLTIIVAAFLKCSSIIKATQNRPELEWANELTKMIRMSLLMFCIAGAALSMAYYDLFVNLLALLVPLSELCAVRHRAPVPARPSALPAPKIAAV